MWFCSFHFLSKTYIRENIGLYEFYMQNFWQWLTNTPIFFLQVNVELASYDEIDIFLCVFLIPIFFLFQTNLVFFCRIARRNIDFKKLFCGHVHQKKRGRVIDSWEWPMIYIWSYLYRCSCLHDGGVEKVENTAL